MKELEYRSIKVAGIHEMKKSWSNVSNDTIANSIQSEYDKNDVKRHKLNIRIHSMLFYYNKKNIVGDVFIVICILVFSIFIAFLFENQKLRLINSGIRIGYQNSYLVSVMILFVLWVIIRIPKHIKEAIIHQMKID